MARTKSTSDVQRVADVDSVRGEKRKAAPVSEVAVVLENGGVVLHDDMEVASVSARAALVSVGVEPEEGTKYESGYGDARDDLADAAGCFKLCFNEHGMLNKPDSEGRHHGEPSYSGDLRKRRPRYPCDLEICLKLAREREDGVE
jgi:hypothetical protein